MSKKSAEEIKECFILFDKDADGKIPIQELGTLVRSLGQTPTEAEVNEIAHSIKNSFFTASDLQSVMSRLASANPNDKVEEVRGSFRVFDRDGTGAMGVMELRHILIHLGEKMSDQEVNELIKLINVDSDGQVIIEDIVQLMCNN